MWKELIGWGRHREQSRANEADAKQVWGKRIQAEVRDKRRVKQSRKATKVYEVQSEKSTFL